MEKYPWVREMKRLLAERSLRGFDDRSSLGTSSDSETVPAESGFASSTIHRHGANSRSGGVPADESLPSVPSLAPGQPFFELLNLVKDPETIYSDGLALMVARFGNIEIMRAFKARGWLKKVAAEKSWLSSALLGRRVEMGRS